ncbi:tripartite-type tricarboxylate transporter receptor subunit TctC [Variovorax paradoxus]|uniref:Tripartite-type tricarboxylate transporter receptor subunit TctC n=1 Tax=Variovorax paradoxus TaxID=34073 RepID=A0AAE3Y574_VARPD|nr:MULTISPECIES: tripartite tricarboxylate transporter substrate binding protein [Variovorax]MBD9665266.1 tripartite tricarboxylate transporter substrate binding protein [Variovorax sp. VRV01]MDP9967057.1 tripartite-type tricarboxylate transporter receptor subunit TctC [Variovorax paradoxus]MDR6429533.1 tripartite-type tricarboxylate transporter receptor subunit TctC [Variovorax paradoxus]
MNTSARRAFVIAFLGLLAASAMPTTAVAQAAYPSKTVKIVVPYPPGGTNDSVARVLAQRLGDRLGQPFIVENKAGASGNLGAEFVARAPADGYTLILVTMGHTIHPSLYKNLRYDIRTDLAPITSLTTGPALLMVNPNMGVNSLKDLIALAKSKPGALNFSSAGNGSSTHLATEYLSERAGIKMTHIPFNGSAPAMMDVIAGNSQVVMDMMFSATPQVKGGKLKAIAQTGAKRSPAMPDVPTVAEAGLPGFDVSVWNGLMAPAGTPKEVIAKLNAEIKRELDSPEFKERLAAQGYEPAWSTPEQFDKLIASDIERWAKVVKTSGAKAE